MWEPSGNQPREKVWEPRRCKPKKEVLEPMENQLKNVWELRENQPKEKVWKTRRHQPKEEVLEPKGNQPGSVLNQTKRKKENTDSLPRYFFPVVPQKENIKIRNVAQITRLEETERSDFSIFHWEWPENSSQDIELVILPDLS